MSSSEDGSIESGDGARPPTCGSATKVASDIWDRFERATRQSGCWLPWQGPIRKLRACTFQIGTAIPRALDKMISFWNARVNQWEAEWLNVGPRRMEFGEPNSGTVVGEGLGAARRLFITAVPRQTDHVQLEIEKEDGKLRTDITVCQVTADGSEEVLWHHRAKSQPERDSWSPELDSDEPAVLIVSFRSTVTWPGQKFEYEVSYEPHPDRSVTAPVDGFADIHLHQLAAHGFAGLWYWPEGDADLEEAPIESASRVEKLAKTGLEARIHAIPFSPGEDKKILHGPPATGRPDRWPMFKDIAHQQAHAKWLKGAHERGLNLVVASTVNFEPLCYGMKWLHPNRHTGWSCRDMHSVVRQIEAAHEMAEKYPWYRIAVNPWHAREIIHDGDLAVVLSMEVSHPFPGGLLGGEGDFAAQLDRLWGMGLRSMQLAHETNSKFAGAAPHRDLFEVFEFFKHPPVSIPDGVLGQATVSNQPGFDRDGRGKNEKGLTPRGRQLLDEMMDRHMLVDVAHLSERAVDDVYEKVATDGSFYPIYDSHTMLKGILTGDVRRRQEEFLTTCRQAQYIEETGGIVGLRTAMDAMVPAPSSDVANDCHGSSESYAQLVDYAVNRTGLSMAFGSDLNGMATQVGPRFGSRSCPGGGASKQERLGAAFDSTGLSHVGQLPDLLADLETLGAETDSLRGSAEAFLEMWERTWREDRRAKKVVTDCSPPWGGGARTVVVDGRGRPGSTGYTVEVTGGDLQKVGGTLADRSVTKNASDEVSGATATGRVGDGADGYRFAGDIVKVHLEDPGSAAVYVDGEPFHTLVIDGGGGSGASEYTVRAVGSLELVDGTLHGTRVTVGSRDRVSGDSATGRVAGGADGFLVSGGLPVVDLQDPSAASVTVDSQPYHTVVIDGTASTAESDYRVLASGGVQQVDGELRGRSVTANANDEVSGTVAEGHVAGAADGYVVRGAVRDVQLDAPIAADVYVDGEPFHTVVIDGSAGSGGTDYQVRVSGRLEQVDGELQGRGVTTNANDEVTGSEARGHVAGAADGFRVYGEVESVELADDEAAAVLVDGVDWESLLEQLPGRRREDLRAGSDDMRRPPAVDPSRVADLRARFGSQPDGGEEAASLEMSPVGRSGIRGMASITRRGDSTRIRLLLDGLEAGRSYPAHLHRGSCGEDEGVAAALAAVAARDSTGSSTTSLPSFGLSPGRSYFIQAHLPDGTPATCGGVPAGALGTSGGQ